MGASNVAKVFTTWSHTDLTHRELLALAFMANISIDQHTPPVYFAGWGRLADALGLDGSALVRRVDTDLPLREQVALKRASKSVEEQVRRVLGALAKAGAVVSSGDARRGTSVDYAVTLDADFTYRPTGKKVDDDGAYRTTWKRVDRVTTSTEKVGLTPPNRRGKNHRMGGHSPTEKAGPIRTEDQLEDYEENQSSFAVTSPAHGGDLEPMDEEMIPPDTEDVPLEERTTAWVAEQLVIRQAEYERTQALQERRAS